ncbi:MAG: 2-polyprenyl-6-methoxyphenol hydroxylase [Massilia sp.]|jgi:2-polyprenyl-6-methoxyphenol hydroxylase-like FAD-dependent oxidoreductase|nr:2-polyprenyl-6-methoxyphenol hydroxylase [Massilia sp.]MDB5951482.1 2-polyprenyl-6-methoxyphenol hydroxylase [Massilia sp.]
MNPNEVIIVGAGPVGLTLAVDLGKRGIRCTLLEQKPAPEFLPKMERANARTMEMFRRIGLADAIRKAGLRADCPMDVFVALDLKQPPLLRLRYPSVDEARSECRATNDGSSPLEPYQLISQYTIEPLLKDVAQSLPSVTVRYGTSFESFEQDADGVTVTVSRNGQNETLRAAYLVGCDGGASPVRKQLGIKLRGEGNLMELRQALFRCDELFGLLPTGNGPGHGRHYHIADDKASFLIMQDSTVHWSLHAVVSSDEEMRTQFEKVVGFPVKYEMLYCAPWRQNLLLADRYRDKRVFLAGDAAHLVIPTGGLGMNTGVGDAFDLSWKLAASLQGWGGSALLDSYETERRQVGERNIGASRYASIGRRKWRSMYRANIADDTPAGKQSRDLLAAVADVEQRKTNEMVGAEMGYRYVDSPIIVNIPGGPEHLFREYNPTTWPGARLPHVWLDDGTAMQDRLPDGYCLLKLGGTGVDTSALEQAIVARGAPLTVLDVPDRIAREIYGHDLILLRPDMHVVWRGQQLPDEPEVVAAIATGHQPSYQSPRS